MREETILLNFRRQHPQHVNSDTFARVFIKHSLSLGIGLRRFMLSRGTNNSHYYNAKLIEPDLQASEIDLSLINLRGLITETGLNKSKPLSDSVSLSNNKEHIIVVTETHLTTDHGNEEILVHFPNYTIDRLDRDITIGRKTKCGGVLLLTSPGILSTHRFSKSNGACEINITFLDLLQVKLITVYRPPDATLQEFDEILEIIDDSMSNDPLDNTILLGDFNFPKEIVEWLPTDDGVIPLTTAYRSNSVKHQFQNLLQLTDKHFLHQLISELTNGINVLDLVFTDAPLLFHTIQSANLGISDHNLITLNTDLSTGYLKSPTVVPDDVPDISKFEFNKANQELFKQKLHAANLTEVVNSAQSADSAKTDLINKIVECAQAAEVPLKTNRNTGTDSRKEIKKLYRSRGRLNARLRSAGVTTYGKLEIQRKISDLNNSIQQLYLAKAV